MIPVLLQFSMFSLLMPAIPPISSLPDILPLFSQSAISAPSASPQPHMPPARLNSEEITPVLLQPFIPPPLFIPIIPPVLLLPDTVASFLQFDTDPELFSPKSPPV